MPQPEEFHEMNGAGPLVNPENDIISNAGSELPQTELRRVLKERHVNMIAFSACVGMGLFLQSGRVIYLGGPGLAIIAYLLSGSIVWCVAGSLGEMTALFPIQGGLFVFPRRFLDEGVGYAAGWLAWFSWVIVIGSEIGAVAELWNFRYSEKYLHDVGYPDKSLGWQVGQDASPAVWVTLFLTLVFFINCLPVLAYGRLEYIFGCMKMVFIVGLILFNVVINAQYVRHDPKGRFWTWRYPFSFASHNITISSHNMTLGAQPSAQDEVLGGGRSLALILVSTVTTAIFSMMGFETVSITAAENKDLGKTETIKLATRKIALRLILLYTLATTTVGLNVPYTDPYLRDLSINSIRSGQNSIFILAAVRNHIRGWPNFFNGFFIFSATTSGINSLYLSSRILHALASIPEFWPDYGFVESLRFRLERTKWGVPYGAVFTSWLFGLLAFLSVQPFPSVELGQMSLNSVVSMLIVYAAICGSYIQFYYCVNRAAEGKDHRINGNQSLRAYDRRARGYPYRSWGQWFKAVYGLVGCALLAFLNGWRALIPRFSKSDFIASYISFPIFVVIILAYHVKIQGWNPLGWSRLTNMELQHPAPVVVTSRTRRGRLECAKEHPPISQRNVMIFVRWVWTWLK